MSLTGSPTSSISRLFLLAAAAAAKNFHREVGRASETPTHRIQRVAIIPNAALAADAANYATITLTNVTRNKTIATWSTVTGGAANTGALVAGTPVVPTIQADGILCNPGDVIRAAITHAGTGGAIDAVCEVHLIESVG